VIEGGYFGVLSLKCTVLNAKEASRQKIMENAEIRRLKKILRLQKGKEAKRA
jgi:DNA gyrase/topoisomerase IV subunit B